MTQQYETGHAKNIANLQKLIEQITVYTDYNPAVETLKKEALSTLHTKALTSLKALQEARNNNKIAIHKRQQAYKTLKKTCSSIISQLQILSISEETIDQAKGINRLIQGRRRKSSKKEPDTIPSTKTVSTSRQSYTQLANNFSTLIQVLDTISDYKSNITELTLEELKKYYETLRQSTKEVNQTEATLNSKLMERDAVLYNKEGGLYRISQKVKNYIKIAYGKNSPEYTHVSKIKFTNK